MQQARLKYKITEKTREAQNQKIKHNIEEIICNQKQIKKQSYLRKKTPTKYFEFICYCHLMRGTDSPLSVVNILSDIHLQKINF